MTTKNGMTLAALLPIALPVMVVCQSAQAKPIDLVIQLQERVPVQQLAQNALKFGITYTPDEIRNISGPTDADYNQVISNLKAEGFQIVSESKTHLFVTVRGEQNTIENTFETKMVESNGSRRATLTPMVPAHLALIKGIVGLDNTRKIHPRYKVAPHQVVAKDDAQPGILPADIKTAYGFNAIYSAGYTGKGQTIAIATYDNIHLADVQAYYSKVGLTTAPSVDVVSFNGTATYNMDSAMETELDAEFSGMIAPGATIHIFASAENSDAGELAMFTAILSDGRAKVVNYSWGSCETQLAADHKTAMDTVYAQAVAQGVNIMVASGDSGSDGCQDGTNAADYPASEPNVVAVGGTTLVNDGTTFETGWSDSGGGVSALFALPGFQSSFAAPYSMRSFPDVAFNADPSTGEAAWEYVDSDGSASAKSASWLVLGGTSIAAPQWSGFLTLVGEARAAKGLAPLGFLNPQLYALNANAASYAANFNDSTSGNNGAYSANAGWDAVTGWGSMQAASLFTALTSQ
jgi:kumamolisin